MMKKKKITKYFSIDTIVLHKFFFYEKRSGFYITGNPFVDLSSESGINLRTIRSNRTDVVNYRIIFTPASAEIT